MVRIASGLLSQGPSTEIQEIRKIPLISAARDFGKAIGNGRSRCPLPGHNDRSPSFYVKAATNSWRCYGCDRGGSVIDLVMHLSGWDLGRSIAWLKSRYLNGRASGIQLQNVEPSANQAVAKTFQADSDLYEHLLNECPLQQAGMAYFGRRAISKSTLQSFGIGQVDSPERIARILVSKYGFERLRAAGLLTARSSPGYPALIFSAGSILFPFMRYGRCQYLQARSIAAKPRLRWMNPAGVPRPPFNATLLDSPSVRDIVLCEGITDTLSAAELGRNAVGLLGASASLSDMDAALLRGKEVYLVADADAAGLRMADRLSRQLGSLGILLTVQRISEGSKDINEYLVQLKRNH